jgi:O-antigen/teichoic acid export membrane protein
MARGLAVRGIGLLGNILLARLLLPRDLGIVSVGMTIVNLGDFLASGGLAAALVRFEGAVPRADLEAVYGFQLLATLLIAVVVTAVGAPLGEAGAVAAIMVWSLVLDTGRLPNTIVLEREMSYRLVLQVEVIETVVWNVWAVATAAIGLGVWGVASAQVARALVAYVVLTVRGPSGFVRPRFDRSRVRRLLAFGAKFQGSTAIPVLRDQALTIAIAAIGGFAAVGVWSIVYRLTTIIGVLLESLWRVSYPAMSRLRETGAALEPVVERSIGIATALTGPIVVAVAGSAPSLIPVLFGPAWHEAINPVPFAMLGVLLTGPPSAVAVGYLLAKGDVGTVVRLSTLNAVLATAVGLPLLAAIGVVGLGIGMLVCGLAEFVFLAYVLRQNARIHLVRRAVGTIVAVLAGSVSGWAIASKGGPSIVAVIASVAAGEAIFLTVQALASRSLLHDSVRLMVRVATRRLRTV